MTAIRKKPGTPPVDFELWCGHRQVLVGMASLKEARKERDERDLHEYPLVIYRVTRRIVRPRAKGKGTR